MSEYLAVPFSWSPDQMPKVSYILDRLVEHESWWSDFQVGRREVAAALLTHPEHVVWEIWHEANIVGLVVFTDITPQVTASFHPIFFDGKLRNALGKRRLLRNLMGWAFASLPDRKSVV